MNIDSTNYEGFFLDYFEGTLSAEKVAELFLFLEHHPELKEEFESFEMISLDENALQDTFENKASLKKFNYPDKSNIDEWLIAEMEGDLNLQQRALLSAFISANPEYARDRSLYHLTKVEADATIRFEGKKDLFKKVAGKIIPLRVWYAAAASLLIILGAWITFRLISIDHNTQTAEDNHQQTHPDTIPSVNNFPLNHDNKLANNSFGQDSLLLNKDFSAEKNIAANGNHLPGNKNKLQPDQQNNLANSDLNSMKDIQQQRSGEKSTAEKADRENEIELLSPKSFSAIKEEEPFVFAERRYVQDVPAISPTEPMTAANLQDKVAKNIKDFTAEGVNKIAGQELLATSEQTPKLPLKSRMLRLTASAINKVAGNKVKVKTSFNPVNGALSAYQLETGKNIYQKQF